MSLRSRIFLSFSAIIALMLLLAAWGTRRLASDMTRELDSSALSVSRAVVKVLKSDDAAPPFIWMDGAVDQAVEKHQPPEPGNASAATKHRTTRESNKRSDSTRKVLRIERRSTGSKGEVEVEVHAFHLGLSADEKPSLVLALDGKRQSIPIPRHGVDRILARFQKQLLLGGGVLFLVGLGLAWLLAYRVSRPLQALTAAARQISTGELGAQVHSRSRGEVGLAISAFNAMSSRLRELDAHNRKLQAREHLGELGEVARGLAHSLRNPLNAIGLAMDGLLAGDLDSDRTQALAVNTREQIRRMDASIRGFLVLASNGGENNRVDLHDLLGDVVLEVLRDAGPTVTLVQPLPRLFVHGIRAELHAILQAIVVNAVEACTEKGEVRITMRQAKRQSVRIEVLDTGVGVPEPILQRLFTPHVTSKTHGAGMGLYLARRIARDRYAGDVSLDNWRQGGVCVRIELDHRHDS